MGASGNLCASVYVSIDENAEATRAVTANVSSYRSLGPARITQRAWAEKPDLWKLWVLKCGKCYVHCVFWNKFSENLHFQWLSPLRLRQNRWRRDLLRVIVELSGPWESLLLRKKNLFFSGCHQLQEEYCNSFFFFLFFLHFHTFHGVLKSRILKWFAFLFFSESCFVWLSGHEFEKTPGDDERQRNLECCNSWGCKKLDTT